jgi:hypothetical protein
MKTFNKITFKDEGEFKGEPFGPVFLIVKNGDQQGSLNWMTLSQARALADKEGTELEEF